MSKNPQDEWDHNLGLLLAKQREEERKAVLKIVRSFQRPGCPHAEECVAYIERALKARDDSLRMRRKTSEESP